MKSVKINIKINTAGKTAGKTGQCINYINVGLTISAFHEGGLGDVKAE